MTAPRPLDAVGVTVTGYDRAALERYFAAVDAERRRLHAEIAAARARVARARAALDGRRVLVAMVERTLDEITAKRRQADLVVGRIATRPPAASVPASAPAVPAPGPAPSPHAAAPPAGPPTDIRWQPRPADGATTVEAVAR